MSGKHSGASHRAISSQAEVVEEEDYDEYDESVHYEEVVDVDVRGDSELVAGGRQREDLEELDDFD